MEPQEPRPAADGSVQTYGFSHGSGYYYTGVIGEFYGDGFPEEVTVDAGLLRLGHERYDIYCSRCHGESGNGAGVMLKHGIVNIANFHAPFFTDRKDPTYRANGSIFETITKGKGLMGAYGSNIPVNERWAIIAWIRALELARTAPVSDPAVKAVWDAVKPKEEPKPAATAAPVAAN